jgi:hypothetical protein
MNGEGQFKIEQLTIGDLVVAIGDAALEVTRDEDMAYEIAALVFMRLLATTAPKVAECLLATCSSTLIH